ncbi:bifunctional phosphopantothenoylcysteine decarboxylase/phosphopantothenate--cysteine ligase CoaBC [Gryllotalpicola sp.]|uniref:bifunctional phosphopantothenoylcysteine decarboxylase/phosphopantothenate--cysteine ligase CoaBC n=1 Tax=Gryllotalpicola sp. TaxID=1932787 RepID=UPI00261A65F2|nr:bifunctional phosphopantothenoylcysteine decarboxylase/phosphopantothenate--cysteine ligase CoaBC [Gryllotalpicola sp.]
MTIVVGVTGGIAAYKAVSLVRTLVLAGHDVHVIPTEAALRFVGTPTWEAISRNPVEPGLYDGVAQVRHVALGQAADLIVIAPATANTIARLAHGLADDLLGNTVLASSAPLVVAPAMHTGMWQNPATQANASLLRARGAILVGPASGPLTGTDSGPGRMAEPDEIAEAALAAVRRADLAGRRVVVSAGGTREPLDPVRFLGNRSSGKQGVALARAAAMRGATVTLIAAHVDDGVPFPSGVEVVRVETTAQLREAVTRHAEDADAVIMAAAVADYRPTEVAERKIKKDRHGDRLNLALVANPDVLAELAAAKAPGRIVVGFAAETEPDREALLALGRAKIARKGCDFLVVNAVGWHEGIASDDNTVMVLDRAGDIVIEASGSKLSVADRILDATLGTA